MKKCLAIILLGYITLFSLDAQPRERVYVQTDKQCYLTGDLLWLKLYTTDADGRLTAFSTIGYVELLHDSIPEVQVKIDIKDGTGTGWMELPAMLPTGYYRMIAYTRYMRNEDENAFFEKRIAIVNPFNQGEELYADETNTPLLFNTIEKSNPTLDISSDKTTYAKRKQGEIRIKGLPAENLSLGVSVAGVDPVINGGTTPKAGDTSPQRTTGIPETGIKAWKEHLSTTSTPQLNVGLLSEYEGAIIDATLIDLATGAPVDNPLVVNLLSFPGKDVQLFAGKTDSRGDITFYTQCTTGKQELTTTAISSTTKQYRIDIKSPYASHTPVRLPPFKPDSTWLDYLQKRNLAVQVAHAYVADSLSIIKETAPCTYLRPYNRYELDEYTRFPVMEELFIEFIMFARVRRTNEGRRFSMMTEGFDSYSNNILVLFDNVPIVDHELIINYNPLLIKTIDVHIGRYVYGDRLFDGMLSFFSYKNDFPGITFGASTQVFDYEGTQPYRYFFTPRHDANNVTSRLPDFRHTLLWEPSLQSNSQNELTIPFTTSDMTGDYVITVEGISANGTVVQAQHMFTVE